jgi:hypothetical protein
MSNKYDKIETDNPLLDEIVYNCKQLMSSCILKDKNSADNAETVESLKNANIYISIIEGRCKFEYFTYSYQDFLDAGVTSSLIQGFIDDNNTIPTSIKTILLKNKSNEFTGNYQETNNYYRKLLGLPNIGDNEYVYLNEDQVSTIPVPVDRKIPVHLLPDDIKYVLEENGTLTELIQSNPTKYYLKHINKHISSYNARKSEKFGLIYVNDDDIEPILLSRFKELIEKNRVYIIKTMDFKAYEFYSDYYDRFLMIMIIVQTVVDMISEMPEYYITRDIFDIRTIEYFFEANGVEFFPNIPLKYQKALVKNLNKLIKFKSTSTNIVDICSLFGFSNVEIFKYYLCKSRKRDENGNYISEEDGDFDLKFLRVPLDSLADEFVKDQSNFLSYDSIVARDELWDGPYAHDYVKQKILEHEFNIIKSKYISIDTVYSLTDATFELSYFVNMVMFNKISKEQLNFMIPILSSVEQLNLVDVFIYLYALMYEYNGVTDSIIIEPSGYLKIKGFNFDANLTALGEYILEKGYTLQELGVSGFQIPMNGILTFNQLVAIFINNKNIYDHIVYEMEHAENKEIYKIYEYLYNSLMLTDLNFDYYFIPELNRPAETYTEYLQYNSKVLYDSIVSIREELDPEKRSTNIYNRITDIASFITEYIGSNQLNNIFMNLPTESGEYVKNYMYKIINFFKSYKITILDIQTIYKLDKENKVSIFDDVFYQYYFVKTQLIELLEKKSYIATFSKEELSNIIDKWLYYSTYNSSDKMNIYEKTAGVLASMAYPQSLDIIDKIEQYTASLEKHDGPNIFETRYRYNYLYNWMMKYNIIDKSILDSIFEKNDILNIEDFINELLRVYVRDYNEDNMIIDKLDFEATITKNDSVQIEDYAFINYTY